MEVREKLWLLGPGRRSEKPVFEQQLLLEPAELKALQDRGDQLLPRLLQHLQATQALSPQRLWSCCWDASDVQKSLFEIYSRLVIELQQAANHRVSEHGVLLDHAGQGCWVWFEYEHDAVAAAASALAWQTLAELEPALSPVEDPAAESGLTQPGLKGFLALAKPLVLPKDTEAFMAAARARNIPCVNLDRSPYEGVKGAFRVRDNSLLKLGHGAHHLIVDGSICVSRSALLMPLLRDASERRKRMAGLQLPLPKKDLGAGNCVLSKHALRSAERIGFPLDLMVTNSAGQVQQWQQIAGTEELKRTLDLARRHGNIIELQGSVPGEEWQILMVGQQLMALLHAGQQESLSRLHPATSQMAERLAASLGGDLVLLKLRCIDIGQDLRDSGGAWLDFDLAPRLDELLDGDPALLAAAAQAFMGLLVPEPAACRIPIVAVTGTNGKTTTCRMVEAIARQSGLGTGMACTGANYVNGELVPWNERLGPGRQFRLLDKPEVQIAILEEYLGTIIGTGFAYTTSDVAICSNVTEDHLGRLNLYDLDALAAAKALVINRAAEAAVLNADNPYSLAMMTAAPAQRIGLVSLYCTVGQLRVKLDRPGAVCVLEQQQDQSWLVLYDGEDRIALLPEQNIPASFRGMARHNTSNAMHAALACYLLGLDVAAIRAALGGFQSDFASSPGRLNVLQGLPFQFIMDYAHNLDGFRVLCEFVDQLPVTGRKILCLAFAGDRLDSDIQRACSFLANHFDYFVCRRYRGLRGRLPDEIPRLTGSYLQAAGVPEMALQLELDPVTAIQSALESARPGDLLVVLSGSSEVNVIWQQAEAHKARLAADSPG
jgi:UDP-N-acetylmuramyl tripeptide synthase